MCRAKLSRRYTTSWKELPKVKAFPLSQKLFDLSIALDLLEYMDIPILD
jgi:hypothetical protein